MRRVHPLWRGFFLAGMMTLILLFLGGTDELAALRGERRALAFSLAVTAGAFLGSVPGLLRRLRRRPEGASPRLAERWPRLLTCFLSGLMMALGCGLAGTGRILPALMEGSAGAFAFVGTAWAAGLIASRIAGRREEA